MEPFGGAGEGGLLDNRDEVLHLTQTHLPHLPVDFRTTLANDGP
ncbi:hypothetical protein P376_6068 [Streptomyces sp. HCCB10043]|nr:hypothetical protein P376_6068 [Streptomyces sp. HCCB10043]